MSKTKEEGATRRDFLKLAGTAAPAAVAAVSTDRKSRGSRTAGG